MIAMLLGCDLTGWSDRTTTIELSNVPPRPAYEETARFEANAAAEERALAGLSGGRFGARVVCDPSCRIATVVARTGGTVHPVTADDAAVRSVLSALPIAKELSRPDDLRLVAVERAADLVRFSYQRGEGAIPCECDVTVDVVPGRGVVAASLASLEGYSPTPPRRSTRGEAREAALRQLVADTPTLEVDEALRSRLTELLVVPVGDRARLVHRFAMKLRGLPYAVDVDDATLEVVRIKPDPRFDVPTSRITYDFMTGEVRVDRD